MDSLGWILRHTPGFKGKRRLAWKWMERRKQEPRLTTLVGGCRIACDLSIPYEAMVWLGLEEDQDLKIARRLLQPGQTFVDCGANIGLWSLTLSSRVGNQGKIFAFEPNPTTADKLTANVNANAIGNVEIIRAAVGARSGTTPFRCEPMHNVSSMIDRPAPDSIQVPVVTLSESVGDSVVHAIKIDVEGHELEVIQGADRIVSRSGTWLCVEFNTIVSDVKRLGDWPVHRYLSKLGYRAWRMADALRADRADPLQDRWETTGYCNLFYTTEPIRPR